MADKISKQTRSKNMAAIKSVSKLEDKVSSELWKKGIRFRRNDKSLYGKPDISIKKYQVVVFIDSCFWHQCPVHGSMPKTNVEFWRNKLNRNKERDEEVTNYYVSNNWKVLRVWEHELKDNYLSTVNKIADFINKSK
ncbi:very short patch repair endonuclease [Virgibacillus halodenitrificans]|uniref:very short patch repair endonuclease n=1 Tax=Virgibacillus halodenitrificans TaxID=1482 RepID=UPI000760F3FD